MLIQFFITLLVVFALIRVSGKFRQREFSLVEFLSWFAFWLGAGVAVWSPDFLTKLANVLGIGRGADLVLYAGLVIVFYMLFRVFVRIEKIERQLTKIVRSDALKDIKKNIDFNSSNS